MDNLTIKKINDIKEKDICNKIFNFYNMKLFARYYKEYYKNNFIDHSFCVFSSEEIVALVLVNQIDKTLTHNTKGVNVKVLTEKPKEEKVVLNKIISYIEEIAEYANCKEIIFRDKICEKNQSILGDILLLKKYIPNVFFDMSINFDNFNPKTYFKNIRKSYKSLINWGENNLEILIIDKNNICESKFKEFKKFHLKISNHKTRSDLTWDIQYQQIAAGFGELILGYLNNHLVAASLILDQNQVSLYAVGVYERDLFEYGLSHSILYKGICRSFERGLTKCFSLGLFEPAIKDQKIYNIQFFKKGFCPLLKPVFLWTKTS